MSSNPDLFTQVEKKIKRCDGKFAVIIGWFLAAGPWHRIKQNSLGSAVGCHVAVASHLKWLVKHGLMFQHSKGFKAEYSATDKLFTLFPGDAYTRYPIVKLHHGIFKMDPGYCESGYRERTIKTPGPCQANKKGETE